MTEMADTTELRWGADRTIDNETLLIGFAFSLNVDSSFGWYNQLIGNKMAADLTSAADSTPWVGMQWEIYDAIAAGTSKHVLQRVPRAHVASPPSFTQEDILNPTRVEWWLNKRDNVVGEWAVDILRTVLDIVKGYLPSLAGSPKDEEHKEWLAAWLNALLEDDNCWRSIAQTQLQFHDGIRPLRDSYAVIEGRRMPDPNPNAKLGPFQKRRVNRLMIDTLCDVENVCLRPMPYLSTQGVLNALLQKAESEGREIRRVRVYGNPVHVERCAKQFFRTASRRGWPLGATDIYVVMVTDNPTSTDDQWTTAKRASWENDPGHWRRDTAQEWCRSLDSWNAYNSELAVTR